MATKKTSTTETAKKTEKAVSYVVKVDSLNVRRDASVLSTAIGIVHKDDKLTITDVVAKGNRTFGKLSNKAGWVCLKLKDNIYAEEVK